MNAIDKAAKIIAGYHSFASFGAPVRADRYALCVEALGSTFTTKQADAFVAELQKLGLVTKTGRGRKATWSHVRPVSDYRTIADAICAAMARMGQTELFVEELSDAPEFARLGLEGRDAILSIYRASQDARLVVAPICGRDRVRRA